MRKVKDFYSNNTIPSRPPVLFALRAVGEGGNIVAGELEVVGNKNVDHEHHKQGQGYWKTLVLPIRKY